MMAWLGYMIAVLCGMALRVGLGRYNSGKSFRNGYRMGFDAGCYHRLGNQKWKP